MSMITATSWVPRGHAAQFPTKYEFNEEEFERISKLAKQHLEDAQEDLEDARKEANGDSHSNGVSLNKSNAELDDDLREYDLEHYDDEQEELGDEAMGDGGEGGGTDAMGMFGNVKNLVYHNSNEEDPYITLKDDAESDSEREELQILPTDNLILAAKVEDEVAHLEVYVYEDEADNLYVHHDVMLPAIPLAVEWIKASAGGPNLVAVGTMDPDIELWDLDTVDCMYPHAILGASGSAEPASTSSSSTPGGGKKKKRKKRQSQQARPDYHTNAVLALASNPTHAHLLASASADTTIKLWDLNAAAATGGSLNQCAKSHTYHTDKVCALAWHPTEPTALLSGSYDRTAVAADMRAADTSSSGASRRWSLPSDVESVRWDPHNTNHFYVSTEAGTLHLFDARATPSTSASSAAASAVSPTLWTLQAHDAALSAFDVNMHVPGFIATGSADKTVKLWRTGARASSSSSSGGGGGGEAGSDGPSLVATRNPDVGRVFGAAFAPDAEVAFRLAVAGSKGTLQVWDTSTNAGVRRTFAPVGRRHKGDGEGRDDDEEKTIERVVGLSLEDTDDDESESGGDEEKGTIGHGDEDNEV